MNQKSDDEWHWLRRYGTIARWTGGMLILFSCLDLFTSTLEYLLGTGNPDHTMRYFLIGCSLVFWRGLLPGMLTLLIADFLWWLSDRDSRPRWLLRRSPTLLNFAAFTYLLQVAFLIYRVPEFVNIFKANTFMMGTATIFMIGSNLLYQIVPVIMLFGLAEAMRRLNPIIEESKSTV